MTKKVMVCGTLFDGTGDTLRELMEILIDGETIAEIFETVGRPVGVQIIDLSDRSVEHCYLIDDEGIAMAEQASAFLVPTMQMTREDKALLQAGKLPEQAVWKFRRDVEVAAASLKLPCRAAASKARTALSGGRERRLVSIGRAAW